MKLAILFWFYKDIQLCENRLQILRQHNPDTPIFGLFGGEVSEAESFQIQLTPYLNDFYAFVETDDPQWKWQHGDLMISQWYRERGESLSWDTIFIAQWDMLVLKPVDELFKTLKQDEILLSGLRPVAEVENWWWWIKKGTERREQYEQFLNYLSSEKGYASEPLCCQFIVACLPKRFLDDYSNIDNPEPGFLEYKIPMYAQLFGIRTCTDHPFNPWWADDPSTRSVPLQGRVLNADVEEVSLRSIWLHMLKKCPGAIFHPVTRKFPKGIRGWLLKLVS